MIVPRRQERVRFFALDTYLLYKLLMKIDVAAYRDMAFSTPCLIVVSSELSRYKAKMDSR